MSDEGARAAAEYLGQTVGRGRFELRSLLGVGGMASVFLAYDSVLDRQVAVKTLHSDLGREQSFRERFRREAQAVAKLTHTNIVSVFDSGEDEINGATVPYIVMEYVEGKPLRAVLDEDVAQHGAMPTEKALKITGDVLAALEASHELGLVHRDIKPGNVMVTKRGVVKVMDFGIARAMQSGVTSMTQTGMVVGTPQYLSPEQALGRGVDARSDIYSVGIMLFELLTGRLPFDADSALAIAYAHVQEEPPLPSSINQSVPQAVDALVGRSLRKNPDERFGTAETMQTECARISGSGAAAGAAPIIISGGPPANSGAGVGQAVFPPVGDVTPPPGIPPQGMPYQPQQGFGFGPSTPPPGPVPGPGPMGPGVQGSPVGPGGPGGPMGPGPGGPMGPGYPAPAPFGQPAPATPPPYHLTPPPGGPGSSGNKSNAPLIAGVAIAAIVVLTLVFVIASSGGGEEEPRSGGTSSVEAGSGSGGGSDSGSGADTESETGSDAEEENVDGFKAEDRSKTIDTSKCTEATESYSEPGEVLMPDFTTKNLHSVKTCLRAAGWKLGDVSTEDENVWGKNAVLDQSPDSIDSFNPKTDKVDLTVSSGKPE
ncbi:protein kinase [Streptomyces sp. HNM0574]|uniref:protein kinase domain-containing protein n=1 Tax=Streptomyces sp. HNM0574 TaxID=2714954 RepID=UPI00146E0E0E|nr:protein kinase [Streptomyces sp. HNM0574]NLU68638.1 serine/threonine protein kinase [Streptomyces sp. HNM0574]